MGFLGINTHNFVKNDPKFVRAYFMQNFIELDLKKNFRPQSSGI